MTRRWIAAAATALVVMSVLPPSAVAKPPPGLIVRDDLYVVGTYDPARDASKDLALALAKAKESGKLVLLDIGGEWCIWCHILDDFLARHKDVGDAFAASFVIAKIDWSPDHRNETFLSAYPRISGYPHFFILDAAGKLLKSQDTSPLERGDSYNPQKMLAFAQGWRKPRE